MIPKQHRLSKERFNAVYERGVVLRSKHFLTRVLFDTNETRFGVAIGKKIEKKASGRNALRRKILAALAECVREKKLSHGLFVVSVLTPKLPSHTEVCDEISRAIASASRK